MASAVKGAEDPTLLSGVRILIADDDPINQEIASRMLKKFGCTAEIASDGDVAVKRFANEKFDLILMDCEMPMMDGPDATRRIRDLEAIAQTAEGRARRIPIMASTARAWCDVRERCVSAGMDDFIVKPFDARQMGETLKRWLDPKGGNAVGTAQNDDSPPASQSPAAAAIDPGAIAEIRKLGGDSLVARVVGQFLNGAGRAAATTRQYLEASDGEGAWRAAHTFKSSAGTLGARRLFACCGEIERLARDEGAAAALPLLETLDTELAAALAELAAFTPAGAP